MKLSSAIYLMCLPRTVLGSTDISVGRVPDSWSQGQGFESRQGCGVVSFSKTIHLHCLVLVQPRKRSQHD